ncbi:MAG: tetratricopeptide repeat protein [Alphaproteobacteria bacterium]|nr:tetratricopeptide repeat protein [Alphaproteobacteria bacterium]
MTTVAEALAFGIGHHRAGRLARAEAIYRQVLDFDPAQPDALHLLGVACHQRGDNETAVDLIGRAIATQPANPDYHINLSAALRAQGRGPQAMASVARAVALAPETTDAWNSLGLLHSDRGEPVPAAACYRRALAIRPEHAVAWSNLGTAQDQGGDPKGAAASYSRALAFDPGFAEAHDHLGQVLLQLERPAEAEQCHRRALELAPRLAKAYAGLGAALGAQGRNELAVQAFCRALELDPGYAAGWANFGNTRHGQRRYQDAVSCQLKALALSPGLSLAYVNLGASYFAMGSIDLAIAVDRQVVDLRPDQAPGHNNLGIALQAAGRLDEAIACYRRALAVRPDFEPACVNLVFALLYDPALTSADFLADVRDVTERRAPTVAPRAFSNLRDPDRRLRVGYLSANFRRSPTGQNLEAFYADRNRAEFELFSYAHVTAEDDLTQRFRALGDHWRSVVGLSDDDAAELIRRDRIDILVTTAGWFDGNRPMIAARRPAPIQVTALDAATSGLGANDYWLTDAYLHPADTDDPHVEELVRLPHLSTCLPWNDDPPIGPVPSLVNGFVTFGSCNNPIKIGPRVVSLWSEVLRAVPRARLVLKYLNWYASPDIRARYLEQFARNGIESQRIAFESGAGERTAHLNAVSGFDIALDPFPFNGWTATLEALWMGVPVVSLAGRRYVARSAGAHLHAVGLDELVAPDEASFVACAVAWAKDDARRAALRRALRAVIRRSPLFDHTGFIRHVEAAYRQMWHRWCAKHAIGG